MRRSLGAFISKPVYKYLIRDEYFPLLSLLIYFCLKKLAMRLGEATGRCCSSLLPKTPQKIYNNKIGVFAPLILISISKQSFPLYQSSRSVI